MAIRGGTILFHTYDSKHYGAVTYCAQKCGEYAMYGKNQDIGESHIRPDLIVLFSLKSNEQGTYYLLKIQQI